MHPSRTDTRSSQSLSDQPRVLLAAGIQLGLLTALLLGLGYLLTRPSEAGPFSVQSFLTEFQRLWPLSIANINRGIEYLAMPLMWSGIFIAWLITLIVILLGSRLPRLAILLSVAVIFGLALLAPALFGSLVLLSDLLLLILVALTSGRVFHERLTARLMVFAIGVSVLALLLDIFVPWERPQPIPAEVSPYLYGILAAIFVLVIAVGFRYYPLRQKLILTVTAVSIVSIASVAVISINSTQSSIRGTAIQALLTAASHSRATVDNFITSASENLAVEAKNPIFADYLLLPQDQRTDEVTKRVEDTLRQLLARRSGAAATGVSRISFLQGYSLLNVNGEVMLDTDRSLIGRNYGARYFFARAFADPKPFASSVIFDVTGRQYVYFSTRVTTSTGAVAGILVARYNGLVFQQIIFEANDLTGPGSYAMLIDTNYNIQLANGPYQNLTFKTALPADENTLAEIQALGLLPNRPPAQLTTNQADLDLGLQQMKPLQAAYSKTQAEAEATLAELPVGQVDQERRRFNTQLRELQAQLFFTFQDPTTKKQNLASYLALENMPWAVVYTQSDEYFLAPVQDQVRNIQLLALGAALGSAVLAVLLAQIIAAPIAVLTHVASGIASGDFSRHAPVEAEDEVGHLADTVNTMAGQLQQTLSGLEKRVEERTQDLSRRSAELQAAAEVGRSAATMRNLNELLPRMTQLISERFGFYHVGIFILDETGRFAVLRASNSEGGQRMLARGHRLPVGQQGIVGYVTSTAQPRIALDVGSDAVFFNNPDLPLTRSEMALPLQSGGRLFGALDVQSTQPSAFGQSDITVLQVMADLIAVAIENARLFNESQQALESTRRAYGEVSRSGWAAVLGSQSVQGYRSTDRGIFSISTSQGKSNVTSQVDASAGEEQPETAVKADYSTLSIPIWVRDTIIGYLDTAKPAEKGPWRDDEVDTITKIVEQVGVALEAARLYQNTQFQAERERLTAEITSRMRASLDVEAVLQVAAQQIRQVMELKTVTVSLQANSSSSQLADSLADQDSSPSEKV